MTVYAGADFQKTSGCCGVTQLCYFVETQRECSCTFSVPGATAEEAWTNLFNQMIKTDPQEVAAVWDEGTMGGRIIQAWFYKPCDYDGEFSGEYQQETLRRLIAAIPGVIDLGEHLNPNSGNMIQGYQWEYKPDE